MKLAVGILIGAVCSLAINTSTQTSVPTATPLPFAERGLKLVQDNREKIADQAADKVVDYVLPEAPVVLPNPISPWRYVNLHDVTKKRLSNRFESEIKKYNGTGGKGQQTEKF